MSANPERKLLGAWIPDASPSTIALVWRSATPEGTVFMARVTRYGKALGELGASNLDELAVKLIAACGPARKSMVKLGMSPRPCPAT